MVGYNCSASYRVGGNITLKSLAVILAAAVTGLAAWNALLKRTKPCENHRVQKGVGYCMFLGNSKTTKW